MRETVLTACGSGDDVTLVKIVTVRSKNQQIETELLQDIAPTRTSSPVHKTNKNGVNHTKLKAIASQTTIKTIRNSSSSTVTREAVHSNGQSMNDGHQNGSFGYANGKLVHKRIDNTPPVSFLMSTKGVANGNKKLQQGSSRIPIKPPLHSISNGKGTPNGDTSSVISLPLAEQALAKLNNHTSANGFNHHHHHHHHLPIISPPASETSSLLSSNSNHDSHKSNNNKPNKWNTKETMTSSCIVRSHGCQTQHPIVQTVSRGTATSFRTGTRNFGVQTDPDAQLAASIARSSSGFRLTGSLQALNLISESSGLTSTGGSRKGSLIRRQASLGSHISATSTSTALKVRSGSVPRPSTRKINKTGEKGGKVEHKKGSMNGTFVADKAGKVKGGLSTRSSSETTLASSGATIRVLNSSRNLHR